MSKERPILFSGPMIRAILEGRKMQTRRIVNTDRIGPSKWSHESIGSFRFSPTKGWQAQAGEYNCYSHEVQCPYGFAGDRLWVREAYWKRFGVAADGFVSYVADELAKPHNAIRKVPSIHMPRWASRITLEVTGVRVERLEDISDEDCVAEGCAGGNGSIPNYGFSATPREHYWHVWESINGKGSWDANPWVWVVEFKRIAQAVSA